MKTKLFYISIITSVLLLVPSPARAQMTERTAPTLESLIAEARDNNPRIKEAFNKWKAAEYKIKSVRSLDDPMASFGYFGEETQTRVGPQEQKYGVSQKIPFPGKLGLKGKAQAKRAEALREAYEATVNEVIKDVKFTYYDLYWIDHSIEINEEEESLLEKVEKVAQRKYESSMVSQQNVIKVQVELSKILEKLFMLRQNRVSLRARLNSLLDREQSTMISKITDIERREFDHDLEGILARAGNNSQELNAARLSVERARYEKSLAKMSYLPDFTIGAEYIEVGGGSTTNVDDGQDAWMGTVSVNVPIWFGKLHAQVKEKEAALEAAREKNDDMENRIVFEAQDIYFKVNAYKDTVLLYETALMPQAEQAFDASQTGFETGAVSFLDWLDTERTFLQTRLAYYKAVTDYHKSIAYLERVIGEDL